MLTTLAKRLGIADRIRRAWKADIAATAEHLRRIISRLAESADLLTARVERLERLERDTQQIKEAFRLNEQQRALVASLDTLLDPARVTAHIRDAIAAATLQTDPFPHIVVEHLLPDDVYALALQAIPPRVFFTDQDPVKQNMKVPMEFGPTVAARFWAFVDTVVAQQAIGPAVFEKFAEPLRAHYETLFGRAALDRARALPLSVSAGRLMLRRPGYHLDPHRDPKRAVVTSLLYFARPHDSEAHGTQIFRVAGDREATFTETYYPEEAGGRCELVKLVPFRPNTALMFVNSGGAHGADIPADASRKIERYAFQFYIGPDADALQTLIGALPPERQAMWRSRKTD
ncbi:MAG: hypothetical protein AB7I25_03745 [Vicinamibacterales bacterium]